MKHALLKAAALRGSRQSKRVEGRRGLIIPPAGPGSIGDAAMLTATIAALRGRGYDRVGILQVEYGKRWDLDCDEDELLDGCRFIDYGSRANLATVLFHMGRYTDIYCVGADILDGIYDTDRMAYRLELLHKAAEMGLRVTILGSSFSEKPSARCVTLIQALPEQVRILARDPYSHERMTCILQRPIELCADVAFLLEPANGSDQALAEIEWIAAQRSGGRNIIAINANNLHEIHHPSLISDYTALIINLAQRSCSILMIPHDSRTNRSDQFIAHKIVASLESTCADHVRTFQTKTPGQLKTVLGHCDLLVTGRMHAAIIALGSHTPAMSFAYANKFEGLYLHLKLKPEEMILTLTSLHSDILSVSERILNVLRRSTELRAQIAKRIHFVREAAERNFNDPVQYIAEH